MRGFVIFLRRAGYYSINPETKKPTWVSSQDEAKVFPTMKMAKTMLQILDRSRVVGATVEKVR
jgi:hypothetical protein